MYEPFGVGGEVRGGGGESILIQTTTEAEAVTLSNPGLNGRFEVILCNVRYGLNQTKQKLNK